ncbi:hypothetical protein ABH904_002797 [Pseudomonas frederiksbergensis]
MSRTSHICLMATYNEWMSAKVYEAARDLSDEELSADRKAFFGSILGTLNHRVFGGRHAFDSARGNGRQQKARVLRALCMGSNPFVSSTCAPFCERFVKSMSQERKNPALARLCLRSQILLADRIVLGRCDEGVTGRYSHIRYLPSLPVRPAANSAVRINGESQPCDFRQS